MTTISSRSNGVDRCEQYVQGVLSGEILAPIAVKQACERYRRDFDNEAIYFDRRAANAAIANIERLKHAKGRWQGQHIHLEPWQCFAVANLFGWKWTKSKKRRFRYCYYSTPRKQGKSLLAAAIALLMLGPDAEPGAEVYLGATSQDLAKDLLFAPARYIVKSCPKFRKKYGIEVNASSLVIPANFSTLKPVIKKPDDGTMPHLAVVDEYHLHETPDMWSVFDTGMGAREQPLLLTTTTAGSNLGGPCHIYRDEMLKLLRGQYEDETTFALIYEPDEGDDWQDFEVWRKVNPNINVTVSEDYLKSQLQQAKRSTSKQYDVRTKHCNEWVGAKTQYLNDVAWKRQERDIRIEDFRGAPCHVAVDLSEQKDATSVGVMFKRGGQYYYFAEHWVPEGAFEWNDRYRNFHLAGQINVTPGNAQDYKEIRRHIEHLMSNYDVKTTRFDPWQSSQMMQELMELCPEDRIYKQTQQFSDYSDPMKTVETAVLDGQLFHAPDPVLTWMVGNTAALKNKDDHMKPVKENPNNPLCKIDGCVAMIMCMKGWLDNEEFGDFDDYLANRISSTPEARA